MIGTAAFAVRSRLRTFTRIDSSQSSGVVSEKSPRVGAIALFISTSSRPYASTVDAKRRSMSASIPMSHCTGIAVPPAARIASTVAWIVPGSPAGSSSTVRAAQTTDAPAAASPIASPFPIPRDAPVTITTCPLRSSSPGVPDFSSLLIGGSSRAQGTLRCSRETGAP